jgi:hypothetical protein
LSNQGLDLRYGRIAVRHGVLLGLASRRGARCCGRIYSIARMGCCKPTATTPRRASLLRATMPCEAALWLCHDVDRRRKLKGWARTG